ncbi:hypothetical protein H257_06494 [Aphanomyces astaci]|uniref:C2 domain-containing protein n=1 Tax=Aphanomyces astaci TaxID=112090 RepID=W4GL87_APHAT|nr:hypothetical protein H257_06494 [Aphanomyces astaci]ETV80101.1 hypothetical protein H257_06494 [Aphanomyces astaci]|eukprot:XP_009830025.1 hypothetical protein H257_06494 [Aphanomyces astaci]
MQSSPSGPSNSPVPPAGGAPSSPAKPTAPPPSPSKSPNAFLQKLAEKAATAAKPPVSAIEPRTLKIFTGTWNVGNKMPPATPAGIKSWVPEGGGDYDIVAIGLQESTYKKKASSSPTHRDCVEAVPEHDDEDDDEEAAHDIELHDVVLDDAKGAPPPPSSLKRASKSLRQSFSDLTRRASTTTSAQSYPFFVQLLEHLGADYMVAGAVELMEIRLAVFVHTRNAVSDVEKITEATGVGNVIGNKGGVVVKLVVDQRSFCFVNCHLAAHEAQKFLERRNSDVSEILSGARVGQRGIELDHQFDHAFWMGDMNYRVHLGYTDPKDMTKEEHWAAVHDLVTRKEYGKLYANDQLQHQMHANKVLAGWHTVPCEFAPTFKRLRGKEHEFTQQRVPSYCDRVLWKSLPGFESNLTLTAYTCVPDISTSDHKPVYAAFDVRPLPTPSPDTSTHDVIEIKLSDVSATNLDAMDMNGQSDPYIKFYCAVPDLLLPDENKHPQTAVLKNTLNPTWDDGQVPALQLKCQLNQLVRLHLVLVIMDWDATSADDPLGQAVVYLPDCYEPGESVPFDVPVVRAGIKAGSIRGKVSIQPSGKKYADWDKNNTQVPGCTCLVM